MDDALTPTVAALLPATRCSHSTAVRQGALSVLQALTCLPYTRLHLHKREVCHIIVMASPLTRRMSTMYRFGVPRYYMVYQRFVSISVYV